MTNDQDLETLDQLLDRITAPTEQAQHVSLRKILEAVGSRSFGPLLVVAGVAVLVPFIGGIPGVPTLIGAVVLLLAVQLLLGREHFWLPRWMLDRNVDSDKLNKSVDWMRKPARFLDRLVRPRLIGFAQGGATYAIATASVLIALALPVMEVVPFSANLAGAALTLLGLALIGRDGLLSLVALVLMIATVVVVGYSLI